MLNKKKLINFENEIVKLKKPSQLFNKYKRAYTRKDNISTIFVEYGDYYK